jgi:hypothetical protein
MAVEAHNAPSTGALSIDQAAGLLGDDIVREEDAPAPAEEPTAEPEEISAEPAAETGEEPEEASPAETEEEPPEPDLPAIEPPLFWDADAKETFKTLPRELQHKLSEQAEKISKDVSKRMQEAAESRKQAETAVQAFTTKAEQIDRIIEQVNAVNQLDGWSQLMDLSPGQWSTLLQQDPDTYRPALEQVNLRKAELQRLQTAKQDADQARQAQSFAAYVAAQTEELGRIAPHLATDGTKKSEIARYLMDQGVSASELQGISARQLILAEKAMRWDQAQKAKTAVKPQPKPAVPPSKPVKPAASTPTPPKQRALQDLKGRLNKTGSIEDAVAYLNARG